MSTTTLSPTPVQRFCDNSGAPLAFGQIFTYAAGSSTPLASYVDSTGITPNTNPIVLNARGECNLWLPPNVAYKFILGYSTDSNPPSNPIWTVDQIVNAQLITLYAGVDTGIVNAYVLNFIANFTTLTNGIILYWTPANTNTGPSTLNVNGQGVAAIVNQDGSALGPGQIVQNGVTAVFYFNGQWLLTSSTGSIPKSGTIVLTVTGGANAPLSCKYSVNGSDVSINLPYCAFTSTSVQFGLSGLPVFLQPATQKVVPIALTQDNGAVITSAAAWPTGVIITFLNAGSVNGWTASGIKGIGVLNGITQIGATLSYSLL